MLDWFAIRYSPFSMCEFGKHTGHVQGTVPSPLTCNLSWVITPSSRNFSTSLQHVGPKVLLSSTLLPSTPQEPSSLHTVSSLHPAHSLCQMASLTTMDTTDCCLNTLPRVMTLLGTLLVRGAGTLRLERWLCGKGICLH